MSVLGRLLVGSGERLDLADLLSIDSYTAADFKYLIQSFVGGSQPYVLKGFDVIQPESSIGTESVSIRVSDSIVYFPASGAGSFYHGLEEGNLAAAPLIPELRKNATNFVYLTFTTTDTAKDSRAFWDTDFNGGNGGEFSQDVNTETILSIAVNVSVSTFPENTIPICKVKVGSSVIESIQDCRDMMFRLGTGGISPNPFSSYSFRNDPSSTYARQEPPTTMTSALSPNPFQGGDKNIYSLKEWMDVAMTLFKEITGATYWYQGMSGSVSPVPNLKNIFTDALGSTLKSKGEWIHSDTIPGQAEWTEDIHYYSLRDSRDIIIRKSSPAITLANDEVAWIEIERDLEFNASNQGVDWTNGSAFVNGIVGAFVNLSKGDWVKKKTDSTEYFLRIEELYSGTGGTGTPTTGALAQSIRLSSTYAGINEVGVVGEYSRGEYQTVDVNITPRNDVSIQAAGGNFFWLAYRSDTSLALSGIVGTQLTLDVIEADGQRARIYSVGHGLTDGDRITIATGSYAGTYVVEVEDSDNAFIETTTTGDSLAQTAFYAIVTTAARSTSYSYVLETANHGFQSGQKVTIANTSTSYDGSYTINVRSATTFQIPIGSLIPNPGAMAGEIVTLPRLNVRTEFGTVKIVQGEEVQIGDSDSKNILQFIGMESLAQTSPVYSIPSNYNALNGHQNYNSDPSDNLTVRAAKLTAMMADRVQDRSIQIIGRTNIVNVTNGANQEISTLNNLTLIKPSSPDQTISLTSAIALPANSAIVIDLDRNGASSITPSVISLGSQLLLQENRLILFYRFATTVVYDWRGNAINASGHINTGLPEDSQNRNIWVFNPGKVTLNTGSGLVTLFLTDAAEITKITVLQGSLVPQSSYFEFNAANDTTEYYVWYDVDAGGTDPAIVGKTGIQVSISSANSANTVANTTMTAINTIAGSDVNASVLSNEVTIENLLVGFTTDAIDISTTFDIEVINQGFNPNIDIIIPGFGKNTIDADAINTLGTLVLDDNQCAWIRINRFAHKTFNTISYTDTPDTDIAGKIYVSDIDSVPVDQDVFVLWSRIGNMLMETHHGKRPDGNVYDEAIDIVAGLAINQYELQGPIVSGAQIQLPPDSRDSGSIQEYIVGSGQLELYLNGQYLRKGADWDEVGTADFLSKKIQILVDLYVGDVIAFRIDANGAVYFAENSSTSGGSLQDAYDIGRFITTTAGQPIIISGSSGKLLSIQGDLEVTGVIDPTALELIPQLSSPLLNTQAGIWVDTAGNLMHQKGDGSSAFNLSGIIDGSSLASSIGIYALNNQGYTITKLTPINSDFTPIDAVYDEDLIMSCIGVVKEDTNDGDYGYIVTHGIIKNITTSANVGDTLYISITGTLTNTKPSIGVGGFVAGDYVMKIGTVTRNTTNPSNKDLLVNIQFMGQL